MNPETIKWLLEHSVSAYETEMKAMDGVKDRISFVLSVAITPIAGITVYLVSKFKGDLLQRDNLLLFSVPTLAAVLFLVVSAGCVAYALVRGFQYSNVPRPADLIPYLQAHPVPNQALEEAQLNLIQEYAGSIEHNFKQNQNRLRKILIAQRLAVASLLVLSLSLPRFVYVSLQAKSEIQAVRIVEPIRVTEENLMSDEKKQGNQTNASPVPTPTPTAQSQQSGATPSDQASAPRPPFPKSHMTFDHALDDVPPGKEILNERKK